MENKIQINYNSKALRVTKTKLDFKIEEMLGVFHTEALKNTFVDILSEEIYKTLI